MCFEKPPKKWLFETHVASGRITSGRITADYYRQLPLTTARNRRLVSAKERHEADDVLL